MTPYEIVREVCIKANPQIMTLEGGCIVKIWWIDHLADIRAGKEPDEISSFCERSMSNNGHVEGQYWGIIEDNVTGTIEILGRPIRLADVLLAIASKDIMPILTLYRDDVTIDYHHKSAEWLLRADDLSQQSPDTLIFLAELLGSKKI